HALARVESLFARAASHEDRARFNGATRSRAWNLTDPTVHPHALVGLQWGHALARVESHGERLGEPGLPWLQWGHALARVESSPAEWPLKRKGCFNGATRSRAWNRCARFTQARLNPRFNGATRSRAWNRSSNWARPSTRLCFNGATRSRAWNPLG